MSNATMVSEYPDFGGLPNIETLNLMRDLVSREVLSLGDVLASLRLSRATDPRDMVYGLLGLVPNCSIRPDYAKATIQDVYLNLVEYCIKEEKSLDIITLCRQSSSTMELPSWVPDWTKSWENINEESSPDGENTDLPPSPLVLKYISGELLRNFTEFDKPEVLRNAEGVELKLKAWSAHGSRPPDATIQRTSFTMTARGVHVGAVTDLGSFTNRSERDGDLFFFKVLSDWEEIMLNHFGMCKNAPNSKSIMDVFDRCLEIMDRHLTRNHVEFKSERDEKLQMRKEQRTQRGQKYSQRQSETKYHGESSVVEAFVRTIVADLDEDFQRVTASKYARFWEGDVSNSTEWAHEIYTFETATNRRLLITQNGDVGLGPINAVIGDHVCILYGCSVPLVLREVDGRFTLIGEAYLQGLMDGEAITLTEEGTLYEKEWTIF